MLTSLVFSLTHPNGRIDQVTVDADRALVGSGAHCELRIAVEDAATEQLLLEARQGMVFGEVRSVEPPTLVNGIPFSQGRILPESRIVMGQVEFSIALVDRSSSDAAERPRTGKPTLRTYLMGIFAVLLGYYVLFFTGQVETALEMPDAVPDLWPAAKVSCPQPVKDAAEARAGELRLIADGKRERSPFHPEDGVAAVTLYRRAAACFTVASLDTDASETSSSAEALAKKTLDDFHVSRIRLERSLAIQDWATSHKVIRSLMAFLHGHSGEYVNWLSNVDRRIKVKFANTETESPSP